MLSNYDCGPEYFLTRLVPAPHSDDCNPLFVRGLERAAHRGIDEGFKSCQNPVVWRNKEITDRRQWKQRWFCEKNLGLRIPLIEQPDFGCKEGDIVIRILIRCILKTSLNESVDLWNLRSFRHLSQATRYQFVITLLLIQPYVIVYSGVEMARTRGRPANRRNNNDNTGNIDPALLAAVNQAVENAIAQSVPQAVANALQNNRRENNNEQPENNDQPENNQPENNAPAAHVLLERFQKQKPESFRDAPTPLDAENWIAHLEKIFDVLEITDNQKTSLNESVDLWNLRSFRHLSQATRYQFIITLLLIQPYVIVYSGVEIGAAGDDELTQVRGITGYSEKAEPFCHG
ncbi:hypothetical protein E3N88_04334 [Mikania micrantha]|uniref:Uncharacterized protein n=1 Tax=Mikania micrantha TaxID=192012 RepID=A0A5N6PVZ9_9ASTR|nr:hypothetical protein E3N88_04334 [Mikania micrantha]